MDENKLLDLIDVCKFLKVSYSELFAIRKQDKNFPRPCKVIGKRNVYFKLGDIQA